MSDMSMLSMLYYLRKPRLLVIRAFLKQMSWFNLSNFHHRRCHRRPLPHQTRHHPEICHHPVIH